MPEGNRTIDLRMVRMTFRGNHPQGLYNLDEALDGAPGPIILVRIRNATATTTATTAMTANRSGYESPTAANSGTLIREIANWPKLRLVL